LEDTARALDSAGYVGSDQARSDTEFVYSTPLSKTSMTVFHPAHPAAHSLSS
jgi:hypothetical protein